MRDNDAEEMSRDADHHMPASREVFLYFLMLGFINVGGPAEILEHGRTGLLFEAKDVTALSGVISQLVTDHGLRRRLGTAAAEDVRRNWLWSQIVRKMRAVYGEVARG
jgi:glycosyltransferase involved in cell wall biosynthesis